MSGRWRQVKEPHRLGDSRHIWIEIHGRACAFTDDQMDVAAARAASLTDPKQRLRRIIVWTLAVTGLVVVMLLTACAKKEDLSPSATSSISKERAVLDAQAWVLRDSAKRSTITVADTGSMAPVIDSRSVLLLEPVSGQNLLSGDIAIYDNLNGGTRCHRVREVSETGVLFTGDNNRGTQPDGWIAHSRIRWRVAGILYSKR
jgi:hypothetical protein